MCIRDRGYYQAKNSFPTLRCFAVFGLRRNVQEHASMLLTASDWLVWTSAQRWRHVIERATNWPWHALQHVIFFFLSRLAASICVMWCWNLWHLRILGRSSYIFPWLKLLHRQPDFDQERERESLAWAMFEISWLNDKLALDRDLLLLCEWFRSTLRRGREKGG